MFLSRKSGTKFAINVLQFILTYYLFLPLDIVVLKVIYQDYVYNSYSIKPVNKIILTNDTDCKNKPIWKLMGVDGST